MADTGYRWNGAYGPKGSKTGPNKGVMQAVRERKRQEAEERNARTPADRRSTKRYPKLNGKGSRKPNRKTS